MTSTRRVTTLALSLVTAITLSAEPLRSAQPDFIPPGHRGRTVAGIGYESRAVERLSHDLERQVERFYRRTVERRGRYALPAGPVRAAIVSLYQESRHFTGQVRHGYRDPHHTLEDFEYLAGAFHRVGSWVARPITDRRTRRDFENVARAFDRLATHFVPHRAPVGVRGARVGARSPVVVRGGIGTGPGGTRVGVEVRTRRGHLSVGWKR